MKEVIEVMNNRKMMFSIKQFKSRATKADRMQLKKYLDMMDGKEVDFSGEYGRIEVSRSVYIYPILKEWCVKGQMHIDDYL